MILSLVRNYLPSHQWVRRRRLEHRRLRRPLLRRRGHARRHRRGRPDRARGAAPAEAVRRAAALHRPAPAARRGRARSSGLTFHPTRGRHGAALRRRDDQRAAAPGDRGPVRRRADRHDEARRLPDQHRPRPRSPTATRSSGRWRAASSPATPATSGSRSPRRPTTRGGRCRTTA